MMTITEKAADKIKVLLKEQSKPEDMGLRIAVRGGGCSGFSYSMDFDHAKEGDNVYELNGSKIMVDSKSLVFVAGSQLDYADGLTGAGFTVTNPNATGTCGCGSSFST